MKYYVPHIILFVISSFLVSNAKAQTFQTVNIDELIDRVEQGGDTTYIVNFWATWCAPCVKELPLFEEITENDSLQKIKVLLVSLDLKRDLNTRFSSFLERRKLKSEVLFLDEKDPNDWIPKVTDQWEGVIPATWLIRSDKSINVFFANAFEGNELKDLLKSLKILD